MKTTFFLSFFLVFMILGGFLFADLPVSVCVDSTGSYSFTSQSYSAEVDASLMKEFNLLSGGFFHIGYNYMYEESTIYDTPYIGIGVNPTEWMTVYTYPSLTIIAGTSSMFYLGSGITFAYAFEGPGLEISDDNCFDLYLAGGTSWDYVNTFNLSKSFALGDSTAFLLGAENELIVAPEEVSDAVSVSAGVDIAPFSFAVSYDLGILPEIDHGISLNGAVNF